MILVHYLQRGEVAINATNYQSLRWYAGEYHPIPIATNAPSFWPFIFKVEIRVR